MIREKNRYYITYDGHSKGKVHKEACRWADRGNGFWVDKPEDIPKGTIDKPLLDCGVCGGRGPRP